MSDLELSPDELLTTTRAVRRRLDLGRPVESALIEECVRISQQAPTAANRQDWHMVVVTEPDKRAGLADLYKKGARQYTASPRALTNIRVGSPKKLTQTKRVWSSAKHLIDHIQDVPVHVIPCIRDRLDDAPVPRQASKWGTIMPMAWSFMLAARARGLGTCLTTFHLVYEREAAELLGIPYEDVTQAGLIPVAHTRGTNFRPAARDPVERVLHWEGW